MLHGETGKKIGTRVPSQSRSFNVTEVSVLCPPNPFTINHRQQDVDSALDRVLAMFNEAGGQWIKFSGVKVLSR